MGGARERNAGETRRDTGEGSQPRRKSGRRAKATPERRRKDGRETSDEDAHMHEDSTTKTKAHSEGLTPTLPATTTQGDPTDFSTTPTP